MRYVFGLLTVLGMVLSSLALREHYRTEDSPCHINDVWDCGEVNHSPYASLFGVPVAVIGIAGYFGLGILGMMRAWRVVLVAAVAGLQLLDAHRAHAGAAPSASGSGEISTGGANSGATPTDAEPSALSVVRPRT